MQFSELAGLGPVSCDSQLYACAAGASLLILTTGVLPTVPKMFWNLLIRTSRCDATVLPQEVFRTNRTGATGANLSRLRGER